MNQTYFPVLPQGWERSQVEQLLIEIAPAIGLRARRLSALLYMMGYTKPSAWTSSEAEPVYFAPQTDTALALGKTERALRNDEHALEAVHGLIEKRVKANGSRSFYGKCGIVFSRLIDLVPDLIELRDRIRADRARVRELVQLRSSHLRSIKRRIEAASPQLVQTTDFWAATQAFEQWLSGIRCNRLADPDTGGAAHRQPRNFLGGDDRSGPRGRRDHDRADGHRQYAHHGHEPLPGHAHAVRQHRGRDAGIRGRQHPLPVAVPVRAGAVHVHVLL